MLQAACFSGPTPPPRHHARTSCCQRLLHAGVAMQPPHTLLLWHTLFRVCWFVCLFYWLVGGCCGGVLPKLPPVGRVPAPFPHALYVRAASGRFWLELGADPCPAGPWFGFWAGCSDRYLHVSGLPNTLVNYYLFTPGGAREEKNPVCHLRTVWGSADFPAKPMMVPHA